MSYVSCTGRQVWFWFLFLPLALPEVTWRQQQQQQRRLGSPYPHISLYYLWEALAAQR